MSKIKICSIAFFFFILIPIATYAQNTLSDNKFTRNKKRDNKTITFQGKIYLTVQPTSEALCNTKLLTISFKRVLKNPKFDGNQNNEQYIYQNVAASSSIIRGNIKRGYCEYVIQGIPAIRGNYELNVDSSGGDKYFPIDAPGCTVSPVFGEPKGWRNPILISSFSNSNLSHNRDFELTRVVAKCDPSI